MLNIVTIDQLSSLKDELQNKKLVVVGGCFDILHPGHIAFLKKAKELGDTLIVFLESNEAVTLRKGKGRPINQIMYRAQELIDKTSVDLVILLSFPFADHDYDSLVSSLKPAIIATTKGDPFLSHKIRQANDVGAKVVEVIDRITDHSTTAIIKKTL